MTSLRHRAIRGVFWQGMGRIGFRGISFAASAVLARLLAPGDFGIMGAVAAAMAAVDAFTHVATDQFIVQHDNSREEKFLSSVFCVAAVRGMCLAVLLLALAPLMARFYHQQGSTMLFMAIALQPLFSGLSNPKAQLLLKDMRFGAWTGFNFAATTVGSVVSIALAYVWKDAWALLVGQLITSAGLMVGSYIVAPFVPRLIFDGLAYREIRDFALRAAGIPVLIALVLQAPAFVLGHFRGMAELGVFTLNLNLACAPVEFAIGIIGTVALPAYSAMKHNRARLARATLTALSTIMLLGLPLAAVLAWLDEIVPKVVYGSKYVGTPHLFALLAAGGLLQTLLAVSGSLFWGIGMPSYDRAVQIIRAILLYGFGIALAGNMGSAGIAIALIISAGGACGLAGWFVRRITGIKLADAMLALVPGILATATIIGALAILNRLIPLAARGQIVLAGGIGALVMGIAGLILWHKTTAGAPVAAVEILEPASHSAPSA